MTDQGEKHTPPALRIFISYATADKPFASELVDALEAAKLTVWWNEKVRNGERRDERIEQELAAASLVVVVWSAHSVGDKHVKDEAAAGDGKRFQILLVEADQAEGSKPKPPLGFRSEGHLEATASDVANIVAKIQLHLKLPEEAPAAPEPRADLREVLGFAALLLASIGLLWWLPEHYAASCESGLSFKLPVLETEVTFPFAWTSLVSLLGGVGVFGAGFLLVRRFWLRDLALDSKVTGVGLAVAPLIALYGVSSQDTTLVVRAPEDLGGKVTFSRTCGEEPITVPICAEGIKPCPSVILPSSACLTEVKEVSLDSSLPAGCLPEVQPALTACTQVREVSESTEYSLASPQVHRVSLQVGEKQATEIDDAGWNWVKERLRFATPRDQLAFDLQNGVVSFHCTAALTSAKSVEVTVRLGSETCGKPRSLAELEKNGVSLLDCLPIPQYELEGSCLRVTGPDERPIEYVVDGERPATLQKGRATCVPPKKVGKICPSLFGVAAKERCVTAEASQSSTRSAPSSTCNVQAVALSLCRGGERAGLVTNLEACTSEVARLPFKKGGSVRWRGQLLPGAAPCDRSGSSPAGAASATCRAETCR